MTRFVGSAAAQKVRAELGRSNLITAATLAVVTVLYNARYWTFPSTPGNNGQYPQGWWGWYDQGHYLASLQAFARGDLSPAAHFYPPLYPLLAAPFSWVTSSHPFFVVDLICLLWSAFVFQRLAERYVPALVASGLVIVLTVGVSSLGQAWIVPWTSSLSTALMATLVWLLMRTERERTQRATWRAAFVFGCVGGAIILTRPLDAVVTLPLALGFAVETVSGIGLTARLKSFVFSSTGVVSGYFVGAVAFGAFNLTVYGHIGGSYATSISNSGFLPHEALRRAVSLVFDGTTVFQEPHAALAEHFPWLVLAGIGIGICLIRGERTLAWIGLAIGLQGCLYAPYADLLPNGMWRYGNIHYFKWMFPYLGLFAALAVVWLIGAIRSPNGERARRTLVGGVACLALCLFIPHIHLDPPTSDVPPLVIITSHGTTLQLTMNGTPVDLVDFACIDGGFTDIYFGQHQLVINGQPLRPVHDFRLLPMPTGVRLLLNERHSIRTLAFTPDPALKITQSCVRAKTDTYRLQFAFQ